MYFPPSPLPRKSKLETSDKIKLLLTYRVWLINMFLFLFSPTQGSFPGNLHLVLVLRPTTLFQRTLSDFLFKFNRDEFKMKVPT